MRVFTASYFTHCVKRGWLPDVKFHQLSQTLINREFFSTPPSVSAQVNVYLFTTFFAFSYRFTICHKTEVVKNTLNPVWQAFKIPVRALCNGDYDRWILFFLWRIHIGNWICNVFAFYYEKLYRQASIMTDVTVVSPSVVSVQVIWAAAQQSNLL